MNYTDILKEVQNYKKIIVTGPQRSGTTFAAYALAKDLQLKFFKETTFGNENIIKFRHIIYTENEFVIQCPGMVHHLPELISYKDLKIIVLDRNINDIIKSQIKIGWEWEYAEKIKFLPFKDKINLNRPIADIKYEFIKQCEEEHENEVLHLDYESMKNHSLWIKPENRTHDQRMHIDKESDKPNANTLNNS